jgi:choline-sulfatase
MPDKPNILLIMSDQHTPHVTGYFGHPFVKTPNLDRLASEGVVFTEAYCTSPVCVASRLSMLTGRHPHRIGVWGLADTIPSTTPTWLLPLSIAGWETIICGRMHLVYGDRNHGFERRLCGDAYPTMRNNFAHWKNEEPEVTKAGRVIREAGPGTARHDAEDAITEGHALKFIHGLNPAKQSRPFAMCVGFYRPHTPFLAPPELLELYQDLPPCQWDSAEQLPPYYQSLRRHFGLETDPPTPKDCDRAAQAYFAMVTGLDRRIGSILNALEQQGILDDTIVIYTSDHGEMLGRQGLWFKGCLYEGAVCVPLIIRYPKRWEPQRYDFVPVSLLDLFPTFCEIAGIEPYPFLDGFSLMPELEGHESDPTRSIFAEYADYGIHTPMRMIRKGSYKMIYADGYDPLVFNLANDPHERNNLSSKPEPQAIIRHMKEEILRDWNPSEIRQRVLQNQQNRDLFLSAEEAIRKATGTTGFPWS